MTLVGGCGGAQRSARHLGDPTAEVKLIPPGRLHSALSASRAREVVARTGHLSITLGYLEKWVPLEIVLVSYRANSSIPVGVVPDPPEYHACVQYLVSLSRNGRMGRDHERAAKALRSACAREYAADRVSTLSHLVRFAWIHEEAAKRGVKEDRPLVNKEVATKLNGQLRSAIGASVSDLRFAVSAELLTGAIEETLPGRRRLRRLKHETLRMSEEVDNEFARFYQDLVRRGTARTVCKPELASNVCSNYEPESL